MRFLVALLCLVLADIPVRADQRVGARDLENQVVHPLESAEARASVLLFLSTECPISNRYAPEIRRLHDAFTRRGIAFWLVYPHPMDSVEDIREHLALFGYPGRALRDPEQALVRMSKATVTPEAAVFDGPGRLVYRGRIDDRYTDFGVDRQMPTRRDLADALSAVLTGEPVREPVTRAVGCFLADLP